VGKTKKLYHARPDLFEFDAAAEDCRPEGPGFGVVLDRTCFYPGGGGQPEDRGTLNGVPVTGMRERDGEITHLTAAPLPKGPVHGSLDRERRLDFMAQHTGQHILSGALLEAAGLETVSVHFGEETTAVEIDAAAIPEEKLRAAEDAANRVIKENRRVIVHEASPEEAARFPLRKPPPDEKRIRVVEIEGFDWSACGGVHVSSTGEVFLIKIVSLEKIRGRLRVHAMIGRRALIDYERKTAALQGLARTLTCGEAEVPALVEKLAAETRAQAKEIQRLRVEQARSAAREAVAGARRIGSLLFASAIFDGSGPEALSAFVSAVLSEPGRFAAAANTGAEGFQWAAAHSIKDGPDLTALLAPLLSEPGVKGGGKPNRMQGSGKDGETAAAFLRRIEEKLSG
jgi:alanyl-tRNA synthetase